MPKRIEGSNQTEFGSRMAKLRKAAGFSQRSLATELGISQRMVAYYEKETEYPPSGILPDLARVLGVSTDELLGLKPVKIAAKSSKDKRLWHRFQQIEKLPEKDRRQIKLLIETFLEKEKLRQVEKSA